MSARRRGRIGLANTTPTLLEQMRTAGTLNEAQADAFLRLCRENPTLKEWEDGDIDGRTMNALINRKLFEWQSKPSDYVCVFTDLAREVWDNYIEAGGQ
jgi:hypothetical protein